MDRAMVCFYQRQYRYGDPTFELVCILEKRPEMCYVFVSSTKVAW